LLCILAIENHRDALADQWCQKYLSRLKGPYKLQIETLPAARVKDPEEQKERETQTLLKAVKPGDTLILCDETGKTWTSMEFSKMLAKELSKSRGRIVFGIGGAYGFTATALAAHTKLRLSDFTFPHHLARVVLTEQLYRAAEIIRGTGYHHL
jgi:23S rRNA (pseudouridine1915-N3)-methyltransferase